MNVQEVDDDGSRKQNSTSTSGEIQKDYYNIVFCKFLCETDVGESCSVSIGKKDAEDHLPPLAPGKSKILEFEDCFCGNNFRMEFVHSNFGDYYLRTGWERYRDEHKLEYGDLLTVYKKRKHNINGFEDQQYFYAIEYRKLTPEDFQDDMSLIMKQLFATLQDPNASILVEQVLAKNLLLYGNSNSNPNGLQLQLPKEEVEDNLHDVPLPQVGREVTLSLFDPIGESVFQMELVHSEKEEYYLGGKGMEEYVAKHKLLIFDTIFVNKVTVNHDDELNSSAECIWEKEINGKSKLDDELVSNCYFYEITYQTRDTKPQKKPKLLGKNNSKGKGVAIPEYDSDEAYWLSCQD